MIELRTTATVFVALALSGCFSIRIGAEESKLDQSLKSAAGYGNTEEVKKFLAQGANPNAVDKYGRTALFNAARSENLEVMKLLIEAGGDVDTVSKSGETVLHIVASECHTAAMKLLIDAGADVGAIDHDKRSVLDFAASCDDPEAVRMLLAAGATPDDRAIASACSAGPEEAVHLLLAAGARPSGGISGAAAGGHAELVQLLLDKGADVDEKNDDGYTALHAAAGGRPETVELLLKHGADPNATNKQLQTPLHSAVLSEGDPQVYQLLIDAGAKLNLADSEGLTPVRLAGTRGASEAYEILLAASGGKEPVPARTESPKAAESNAELLKALGSKEYGERKAAHRELAVRGPAIMPAVQQAIDAGAPVEQFFGLFTALGPEAKESIPLIERVIGEKQYALGAVLTLNRIHPTALSDLSPQSQRKAAEALYEVIVDPKSDVYRGFAADFLASMSEPATPTILRLLRHESPDERSRMIRALTRARNRHSQITAELEKLIDDQNAAVCIRAVAALKAMEAQPPSDATMRKARDAILAIVKSAPPHPPGDGNEPYDAQKDREMYEWHSDVQNAARLLGRFGPDVIDELLPMLTPMDHPHRIAAVTALKSMDESAVPRLVELLKSDDEAVNVAASIGLVGHGTRRMPVDKPRSPEEWAAWYVAHPEPVTQALLEMVEGDEQRHRVRAVSTLGQLRLRAAAAVGPLTQLAGDDREPAELRIAAGYSLLQIDAEAALQSPEVASCIPLLIEQLENGSFAEQVRATDVLKAYGPAAKEALSMLRQRLEMPPAGADTGRYAPDALKRSAQSAIDVIEGRVDDRGRRIR